MAASGLCGGLLAVLRTPGSATHGRRSRWPDQTGGRPSAARSDDVAAASRSKPDRALAVLEAAHGAVGAENGRQRAVPDEARRAACRSSHWTGGPTPGPRRPWGLDLDGGGGGQCLVGAEPAGRSTSATE